MLSSSFIWFFLFSSYNHTRRRPVRHAERSDGDVANRDGIESDVRHAVRRSFLTSRVSPPHVTLSLLITRSVHVGSYPLLPFTSLRRFTLFPLHTPSSPSHYAPEGRGYGNEGMSDVAERAVGRAVGSETRTRNRMRREGVERWVRGRRMPCESSVG